MKKTNGDEDLAKAMLATLGDTPRDDLLRFDENGVLISSPPGGDRDANHSTARAGRSDEKTRPA